MADAAAWESEERGPRLPDFERQAVLPLGADRVIATARVIVAALSLVAMWLDPALPALRADLAYGVFGAYLGLALVVLAIDLRDQLVITERVRLLLHVLDFVFVSLVVYFTAATVRAFSPYFVYLMVAAHLRWQWRGTLWTAIAAAVAFVAIQSAVEVPRLGRSGLDDTLVRLGYLGVVASLLMYIGRAEQAISRRMKLAVEWPSLVAPERALPAYLDHAARVIEAPRLLLVWLPDLDTTAELVFRIDGTLRVKRRDRDLVERWFERVAADARIFFWSARAGKTAILAANGRRVVRGPPLPARLLRAAGVPGVLGIAFAASGGHGWLLASREAIGTDEVTLAELTASHLTAWADAIELARERDEAQARQQWFELASDLHDGVLQTLAGASLQLQGLRRTVRPALPEAAARIDELVAALAAEQSELRRRLHRFTPETAAAAPVDLNGRLAELARLIERRWRIAAEWHLEPPDAAVSAYVDHQLSHLVIEAAANARKHSRARRLAIRVTVQPEDILVSVRNDRSSPAAAAVSFEPGMLRARLDHLGGSLRIRPAGEDLVVDMAFPAAASAHA